MIRIRHDNQYVSYILEDNTKFFPTGYRILKKQRDKGFIPCSRIMYNGHIKLLYPIGEYISVSAAAEHWKIKDVYEWILRILKTLMAVQDNGFIQIDTVDVDLSRMFIDQDEKRVHIIALPLSTEASKSSTHHWEQELERTLISLIEISQVRNEPQMAEVKRLTRQNISSLNSLYKSIRQSAFDSQILTDTKKLMPVEKEEKKEEKTRGFLHFVTRSAVKKADILVDKDAFVLGKNPRLADGVLSMSPTISRRHCMITRKNGKYYIEDLDSVNHTYVNGEMVKKGERVPIKPGDQIRLAEVEFSIEFRE